MGPRSDETSCSVGVDFSRLSRTRPRAPRTRRLEGFGAMKARAIEIDLERGRATGRRCAPACDRRSGARMGPWLREVVCAALVLACLPSQAAGWVKLLSGTAAEKFQEDDLRMFLEAARDTLNAEGPPKAVQWANDRNRTGGSFLVIGESVRGDLPCRRLRFSTYAPGYPNPPKASTTWTACRTTDGRWKLAEAQ